MDQRTTVILATQDAELPHEIGGMLPNLRVLQIGSDPLNEQVSGRIWCFIDWLLPSISGLEICRRLREAPTTSQSHITMVLDEDDSDIRRRVLRAGADNYVQGPLTAQMVAAQLIEGQNVHLASFSAKRLRHGPMTLDLSSQQLRYHNRVVPLPPNEFHLLAHFVEHPDRLFTRSQLIATLGKDCAAIDERTVDVWIGRLRRSLKAYGVVGILRTVRSMGYVLDSLDECEGSHAA